MTKLYDVEFAKHSTDKIKYFGTLLKTSGVEEPLTPVLVDFMAGKLEVENYCEISRILYRYKEDTGHVLVSMKEAAKQHLSNTYGGYTKRWYKTSNWLRHQSWFRPAKIIVISTKSNAFNVREYAERIGYDKVWVIPVTHTDVALRPGDQKDDSTDLIEPEWLTEVSELEPATDWLTSLGFMANGRRAYKNLEDMSSEEFSLRYALQTYGVALGFSFYPTIGTEVETSYTRTREMEEKALETGKVITLNQPVWVERIASLTVLEQFQLVYKYVLDNGGVEAFADIGTEPCKICGTYHKIGSAQCRVCNERFQEAEESLEDLIETKRIRL